MSSNVRCSTYLNQFSSIGRYMFWTKCYLSSMENTMEKLQYPVGRFVYPETVSVEETESAMRAIQSFAEKLCPHVEALSVIKLDAPYRPGGWTRRQVVHHLADSHMNAFIRFKLTLTENGPTIKPYRESEWAKGPDYRLAPDVSLDILRLVHQRWSVLMESMTGPDWDRHYIHPEYGKVYSLRQAAKLYAWHGEHHLNHVMGDYGFR